MNHASDENVRRRGTRLSARLLGLCIVTALGSACSTPPNLTLVCGADADCNNGRECRQGRCLLKSEFICEAVAECAKLLTEGTWTPAAATTGVCFEPTCTGGLCAMAALAADKPCDDADGLPCTAGACDGLGVCAASATLQANTCLITDPDPKAAVAKSCVAKDTPDPDNDCQLCVPDISTTTWTAKPSGAKCDDKDGLLCTSGACNGGGVCSPQGITANSCLIDKTCFAAGDIDTASNGCRRCEPTSAKEGWTDLSEGATCTVDGKACLPGSCATGTCLAAGIAAGSCYIDVTPADGTDAPTCFVDGDADPSEGCRACDAKVSQDAWTPRPNAAACTEDGIACTVDACDGKGACLSIADDALCNDKDGPCTDGNCDVDTKGCKSVPLPTSVTCDGADGIACTVENCDEKGACGAKGVPDDAQCKDTHECTLDACDAATGCTHKAVDDACDDGLVCTADACDVKAGCQFSPNTADCTLDALACTVEKCSEGACKTTIDAATCVIDGKCVNDGVTQVAGCQSCAPKASQTDWTLAKAGAACDDDGASCTADTCSAAGACSHASKAGACDDALPCTLDACDPSSAWADAATGCAFVDDCPYGHACDKAQKLCLTPAPLVIVTESGDDPAPTNPTAIAHVLDAKTGRQRIWVVYQSQAAAVAVMVDKTPAEKVSIWSVSAPSKLRAVLLDPAIAAKPGGAKPKPTVVTFASQVAGGAAFAVFPTVAADPESTSQAWLTWLEGAPGAGGCVDANGRGGIPRLARLDGGAPTAGAAWTAVAGKTCPLDGGDNPGVMKQGFAMLGGAETEPSKRKAIWVRPFVQNLQSPGLNQLLSGGQIGGTSSKGTTALGEFSTVPPVVIDMGIEDANKARFWALALGEEKSGQSYNRELWAQSLTISGAKKTTTKWFESTVTGAGATALANVDAVCSLDAVWDSNNGDAVVVIVVRQAGSDAVYLLRGKPGGAFAATKVAHKSSAGDCRKGYASAVVSAAATTPMVVVNDTIAGVLNVGTYGVYAVQLDGSVKAVSALSGFSSATTDTTANPGPTNALASRGAVAPLVWADGRVTFIGEVLTNDGKHGIVLHTFKP